MREINYGPVANPDGSPTEFTKQMLADTGRDPEEFARNVVQRAPNFYIGPSAAPIIKGLLIQYLETISKPGLGTPFDFTAPFDENDSYHWAIAEIQQLKDQL